MEERVQRIPEGNTFRQLEIEYCLNIADKAKKIIKEQNSSELLEGLYQLFHQYELSDSKDCSDQELCILKGKKQVINKMQDVAHHESMLFLNPAEMEYENYQGKTDQTYMLFNRLLLEEFQKINESNSREITWKQASLLLGLLEKFAATSCTIESTANLKKHPVKTKKVDWKEVYYRCQHELIENNLLEILMTDLTKGNQGYVARSYQIACRDSDTENSMALQLADIFSVAPQEAAKKLLPLLKQQSRETRNIVAKILYRLEFGHVGISEQGVKYLEKIYDLREKNNPNYFVQRLTADGDIGVFDEDKNLSGYFKIDLESEEDIIRPQVMEFVYETLFIPKEDETLEERAERERILEEFKTNYYQFYEADFFKKTGIRFNNLSFPEQAWFLEYTKSHPEIDEKLYDFATKYGEDGLKTFISLESGEEMGEKILLIAEKADDMSARMIFAKYAEIISLTGKNQEELAGLFKDKRKISPIEITRIARQLLNKGSKLLTEFSQKLEAGKDLDKREVMDQLEDYQADLILTASVYKGLDKKEGVRFEDLEGVSFEQKTADTCTAEEIEQMVEIYSKNYIKRPSFRDKLIRGFKRTITEQGRNTMLYMYKQDRKIVAFNRFDRKGGKEKYFGSFNVDPVVQDSAIGSALFKASIEKEAPDSKIEATCDVFSSSSIMYIEKGGFIATKMMPDFDEETHEPAFLIRKQENGHFKYARLSREEIIKEYEHPSPNSHFVLKYPAKSPAILSACEQHINREGYALTRYFTTANRKEVYCVFEKAGKST